MPQSPKEAAESAEGKSRRGEPVVKWASTVSTGTTITDEWGERLAELQRTQIRKLMLEQEVEEQRLLLKMIARRAKIKRENERENEGVLVELSVSEDHLHKEEYEKATPATDAEDITEAKETEPKTPLSSGIQQIHLTLLPTADKKTNGGKAGIAEELDKSFLDSWTRYRMPLTPAFTEFSDEESLDDSVDYEPEFPVLVMCKKCRGATDLIPEKMLNATEQRRRPVLAGCGCSSEELGVGKAESGSRRESEYGSSEAGTSDEEESDCDSDRYN